jgi:hypothetical protein
MSISQKITIISDNAVLDTNLGREAIWQNAKQFLQSLHLRKSMHKTILENYHQ